MMEFTTDSSNRVYIKSNKQVGHVSYNSFWLKVYGKKNPHVMVKGKKVFLEDLKKIEDYQLKNFDNTNYYVSQFYYDQEENVESKFPESNVIEERMHNETMDCASDLNEAIQNKIKYLRSMKYSDTKIHEIISNAVEFLINHPE